MKIRYKTENYKEKKVIERDRQRDESRKKVA